MSGRGQRLSRASITPACVALAVLLTACGSHTSAPTHRGRAGSAAGGGATFGATETTLTGSTLTAATSSAAAAYCRQFDSAVTSVATGFSFAPALSVYAPGTDPGVGGTIGANLRRLSTGSYTCQWRTASADIELGIFLLHAPSTESAWETANAVDLSSVTEIPGIGDWAYTQSGTSAVIAGLDSTVLFVDTDGAPAVDGQTLAGALAADLG